MHTYRIGLGLGLVLASAVGCGSNVHVLDTPDGGDKDAGLDGGPMPDGARPDAPARDAGDVMCGATGAWVFPTFDRTCGTRTDCTVVEHQVDCCGTVVAQGIRASERASFEAAEAACRAMSPDCECRTMPTMADDGTTPATAADEATVSCTRGTCTSSFGGGAERYWTAEPAVPIRAPVMEGCEVREGSTAVLTVSVPVLPDCEQAGPVDVELDETSHTVTLRPNVWHEHGVVCGPVGEALVADRTVLVEGLRVGDWNVVVDGVTFAPVPIRVDGPPPPMTCTDPGPIGSTCLVGCDCTLFSGGGARCTGIRGDAVCESRCTIPCSPEDPDLPDGVSISCTGGLACALDVDLGYICQERGRDTCASEVDCPAGMGCTMDGDFTSYCEWTSMLSGGTRHACRSHEDCEEPGLECVEIEGARSCQVRCLTDTMPCPLAHLCKGGLVSGTHVCEWVGE